MVRNGSGLLGSNFRQAASLVGSSGSFELPFGFENGSGAPLDAKRSGRIAAGVAFTKGMSLLTELLSDFCVASEFLFCLILKVEKLVCAGSDPGLNDRVGGGVNLTSSDELGLPRVKGFFSAVKFNGSLNAHGGLLGEVSPLRVSLPGAGIFVSDISCLGSPFESEETYFID